MENYENVMIYENSEYNGLENLSSIENTENWKHYYYWDYFVKRIR